MSAIAETLPITVELLAEYSTKDGELEEVSAIIISIIPPPPALFLKYPRPSATPSLQDLSRDNPRAAPTPLRQARPAPPL